MKGKQKPPPGREETTAKGNNVLTEVTVKKVEQVRERLAYVSQVRNKIIWSEEEQKELE